VKLVLHRVDHILGLVLEVVDDVLGLAGCLVALALSLEVRVVGQVTGSFLGAAFDVAVVPSISGSS
jgi:hypothetical protein